MLRVKLLNSHFLLLFLFFFFVCFFSVGAEVTQNVWFVVITPEQLMITKFVVLLEKVFGLLFVHGDFLYSALRPKHAEREKKQNKNKQQRIDLTFLCRSCCKISQWFCFFFITSGNSKLNLLTPKLLLQGLQEVLLPLNGFQPVLFDVEMHGVIATTPVCCNTAPPFLHPCSAGPSVGHKPVINRRGRGSIWEKWALSAASENVWSNALNYWGQWLRPLCWFVCGHRRLTLTLKDIFSTTKDCKLRDMPAPEQLMWGDVIEVFCHRTPTLKHTNATLWEFKVESVASPKTCLKTAASVLY